MPVPWKVSLAPQAWWLLFVNGIFTVSVGLSNTFVNIYIWKVDKSYTAIGLYNLVLYVLIPVTFIGAGVIAKRVGIVWTIRIGVALHAVFYALTLGFGDRIAQWPTLLGAVMGLAAGFYWLSFNLMSLMYTKQGSREGFYGMNGVIGAVAGMVAPPVAGYLITKGDVFPGAVTGYHVTFALSLGLFILAVLVSLKLKSERRTGERLQVRSAWAAVRKTGPWRMVLAGCSMYGLREGVFMFLVGVLLYVATGSELKLGEFVLLQSALSFVSFYIVGKVVKPSNRIFVLGIGAVLMAMAALLFSLPVSARVLVWYGSLIAVVLPLFLIPLQGFVFDGISAIDPDSSLRMEHVIMREVFENAGRVVGIAVFLVLVSMGVSAGFLGWYAVALGFVQIGTWFMLWRGRATKLVNEKAEQDDKDKVGEKRSGHNPAPVYDAFESNKVPTRTSWKAKQH